MAAYVAGCLDDLCGPIYIFPSREELYACMTSHPNVKKMPRGLELCNKVSQVFAEEKLTLDQINLRIDSFIEYKLGRFEKVLVAPWLKEFLLLPFGQCLEGGQIKRVQQEANHVLRPLCRFIYPYNDFTKPVEKAARLEKDASASLQKGEVEHRSAQTKRKEGIHKLMQRESCDRKP